VNLGELLAELREGILNDRTDRVDGTPDYLWTDATLKRYINEAQRRFAVQGLVIRDSSTDEVTKVTLVEGQTLYPLHESIIAVISAKNDTDDADLSRLGHSMLAAYRAPSETWYDPSYYSSVPAGATIGYSTDEGVSPDDFDSMSSVTMRVYPAPSADQDGDIVRLRVVRKPIEKLVSSSDQPEIPEDHHIEMLDWAAYLALRIVDDDAGNPKRAADFRESFEVHVRQARVIVMRKLFAPARWGFGHNGFSWEH